MKIVLVGNQNSGKTTIFNYITKQNEKIGNWPGVTTDIKTVKIKNHYLTDLPGIYSLSPYSQEESIAVSYLQKKDYDLIINIIDINLIERSLYLTKELSTLNKKIIILLTHISNYNKKELIINKQILKNDLNIKVIDINNINEIFIESNNIINKQINIENIVKKLIIKKNINNLDKIFLNRIIGIPLFIIIMIIIYYLSIITTNPIIKIISELTNIINNKISIILNNLNTYPILIDLIINGILKGINILVVFIPQLLVIFILIEILKQTGYLIRITYLLDGILNRIGLSGKSIISFIVGSNCNVPGIIQSRIIDNKIKREKTIILTPFIPCSAKLSIILMISNYLNSNTLVLIIYLLVIIVIIIISIILNKIYEKQNSTLIIELPNYQLPNIKYLIKEVINKIKEFIKRISSFIVIISIINWILINISPTLKYINNIQESILYSLGIKLSYLFYPFLGSNNWQLSISIIEGIISKENVVATLNILNSNINDKHILISFLIFNLFSIPCINTVITLKQEINNNKKLILILLFQLILGFILSTIIYQVGNI